jgi:hypothetical protein
MMRVLLTLLSLLCGAPDDLTADEFQQARIERTLQYRTLLAEIAPDRVLSGLPQPRDLPDDVREAVEAWTKD